MRSLFQCLCPCFKQSKVIFVDSETEDEKFIQQAEISNKTTQQLCSQRTSINSSTQNKKSQKDFTINNQVSNSNNSAQTNQLKPFEECVHEDNPYYLYLGPKMCELYNIFQCEKELVSVPFKLQLGTYPSERAKTNIFVYSTIMPGTRQMYQAMMDDLQLQKTLDGHIDIYTRILRSPAKDISVIYLAYKKVLIVSPRDFLYAKYSFSRSEGEHWVIATSIKMQDYGEQPGKVRGEIFLTATRIMDCKEGLKIDSYSEVDMKLPIKPDLAKKRGKNQITKYVQNCRLQMIRRVNDENKRDSL